MKFVITSAYEISKQVFSLYGFFKNPTSTDKFQVMLTALFSFIFTRLQNVQFGTSTVVRLHRHQAPTQTRI